MSDQKQQYLAPMQQQGQQTSIPSLPTATSMNSNGSSNNNNQIPADSLTCQWTACRERCETPEALYVSLPGNAKHVATSYVEEV
jgi:hypothetical protein